MWCELEGLEISGVHRAINNIKNCSIGSGVPPTLHPPSSFDPEFIKQFIGSKDLLYNLAFTATHQYIQNISSESLWLTRLPTLENKENWRCLSAFQNWHLFDKRKCEGLFSLWPFQKENNCQYSVVSQVFDSLLAFVALNPNSSLKYDVLLQEEELKGAVVLIYANKQVCVITLLLSLKELISLSLMDSKRHYSMLKIFLIL